MNNINFVGKPLRTYSVQAQSHKYWEIIYCTEGRGEFFMDSNESVRYEAGDIIAIPPNTNHANHSEAGFANIHLTISDATLPYKSLVIITDDVQSRIFASFEEAFYYFNSDIDKKDLVLAALGDLIVSYIIVYHSKEGYSGAVEDIRRNILQNFSDVNYKLDEYLKSLPFSYDYLRKLFKKEMSITPHEYLVRTRMTAAAKLLKGRRKYEYSISEIGEMCGFSEPLYFSRVFKNRYGCSPSDYSEEKD